MPHPANDAETAVAYLRSPLAVRARCENILEAGLAGKLAHFSIDLGALPAVVDEVIATTRASYPDLNPPPHGRMNHFRAGGVDRVAALDTMLTGLSPDEVGRAWIDLVVVSMLLGRSEASAVASYDAFVAGVFSSDPTTPLRVDAAGLSALDPGRLSLASTDERIGLLRALGEAVAGSPMIFPGERPGGLLDHLVWIVLDKRLPGGSSARRMVTKIDAPSILTALLDGLSPLWPGRIELAGTNLGDVWPHPAAGGTGASAGLVPFHQLSQWLSYSLFEPLHRAGLEVTLAGALTGLPDYRHGGLLVDLGVLVPTHAGVLGEEHALGDEVIVEWRALTIALLDRVAESVRGKLGKSPMELPLASILEGGTWAAGRAVAARLREGGGPPIRIVSDGTVF